MVPSTTQQADLRLETLGEAAVACNVEHRLADVVLCQAVTECAAGVCGQLFGVSADREDAAVSGA